MKGSKCCRPYRPIKSCVLGPLKDVASAFCVCFPHEIPVHRPHCHANRVPIGRHLTSTDSVTSSPAVVPPFTPTSPGHLHLSFFHLIPFCLLVMFSWSMALMTLLVYFLITFILQFRKLLGHTGQTRPAGTMTQHRQQCRAPQCSLLRLSPRHSRP